LAAFEGEASMWEGGIEPCTQKREVDSHPGWSLTFLEMQRSIMHTTLLWTEEPHEHPYTKVLLLIIPLLLIFNQLLDVACIVLGTTIEVGGIGSTKLGIGNILNILISRTHSSFSHHKLCFFGAHRTKAWCLQSWWCLPLLGITHSRCRYPTMLSTEKQKRPGIYSITKPIRYTILSKSELCAPQATCHPSVKRYSTGYLLILFVFAPHTIQPLQPPLYPCCHTGAVK